MGLGPAGAPISVLFRRNRRVINTQAEHIKLVDGGASLLDMSSDDAKTQDALPFGANPGGGGLHEKVPESRLGSTALDHYAALGIPADFTTAELKAAYRRLKVQAHPDRGGSVWRFQEVAAAHEVLSDPGRRRAYRPLSSPSFTPFITRIALIRRRLFGDHRS